MERRDKQRDSIYLPCSSNRTCRGPALLLSAGYEILTKPGPFSERALRGFKTALIYSGPYTKRLVHHKYTTAE